MPLRVRLDPQAETQARRALPISQSDPSVFITHPISPSILALSFVRLVAQAMHKIARRS